jgi:hypothetical protein
LAIGSGGAAADCADAGAAISAAVTSVAVAKTDRTKLFMAFPLSSTSSLYSEMRRFDQAHAATHVRFNV